MKEQLLKIKHLVQEALSKKDKCNCGCHSCENVGNKGPVLNNKLNAKINMTENMKYHVDNKLPLSETKFPIGSKEYINLWAEARYLYSCNAIHLNDNDKKIVVESCLGEYGIHRGKKVPLDLQIVENNNKVIYKYNSKSKKIIKMVNI